MKKLACAGLAVLLLSGCAVTNVGFADDPIRMTIIQRQSKRVPGSPGALKIEIGDITGGQVLLSIRGTFNRAVVDTLSVEPGDVVPFRVGKNDYRLRVLELRNLLVGDDFGVFEISAARAGT